MVAEQLEAPDVYRLMTTFRDALRSHQELINRLNVYPVPDGDTGTNMALTVESVIGEIEELGSSPDMSAVCRAITHGSLMGARGNSGVILSQLLRGFAEGLAGCDGAAGAAELAATLCLADEFAREAVMRPVEGTILTVARGAAEAAKAVGTDGRTLVEVAEAARTGAAEALERTPALLPVLREAGVVDAGGTGYLLLFDALLSVIDGRALPEPPDAATAAVERARDDDRRRRATDSLTGPRYEVMYLLEAPDETIPSFKDVWAGVGDSIVVVGGDGLWNCHIHTDDIGAAIEASMDAGRPRNIRVTDLQEEVEEEQWVREAVLTASSGPVEHRPGPTPVTGVVAVASGDGIARIFRSLGVEGIIAGGQTMNPSIAELVEAVDALGSEEAVLLPNNGNIRPVADRVGELSKKPVWVIPTESVAEGFAALLAYDPGAGGAANAAAMEASAQRVVAGEITRAVRDAESAAGPIARGDWLGLSRQGIEVVNESLGEAACALLEALVTDDHELVTIIEGEESGPATTRRITEWLREKRPHVETEVHHGGQPLYPYLFSIE